MTPWQLLLLAALALTLGIGYLLARAARGLRSLTGLPKGEVIYADTSAWQPGRVLFSEEHRLSGKPDYLLRLGRQIIPIEVKPRRRAEEPYDSDVMQLATYCLLVEECLGKRPSHGLLCYHERTFRIPYTASLRRSLLACVAEMRGARPSHEVARSHHDARRCGYCGQRNHCGQDLAG